MSSLARKLYYGIFIKHKKMAVKIRLQRHGKKGKPFYWIVAADARAKRDGKYLEKLGTYNPTTSPSIIDLNLEKAVIWLHNGAQPTDTARTILSYKGALLKHHLDGGVRKGALTQEEADAKLAKWLEEKATKEQNKNNNPNKTLFKDNDTNSELKVNPTFENKVDSKESNMLMPYSTETEISIHNADINHLEKDKEYDFDISVKVINDLNRKELLKSFGFVVSSPSFKVLGDPLVKLYFNKNVANTSFKVVPKEIGETKLYVNLLQNFKIIDRIFIDLTIR